MTQERLTGYTKDEALKKDARRTVDNPDTPYDSESELVIQAVRNLLGDIEAEEKAAEYNVERRIERKIDEMDRTIEQTLRSTLREELSTITSGEEGSDPRTNNPSASQPATASSKQTKWENREDGGDWQ